MPPERDRLQELVSNLWEPWWTCPNCGRPFARGQRIHCCGPYTVREFLRARPPAAVVLYRRFTELVRRCGPVVIVPNRTRVVFQNGINFATIDRLTSRALDVRVMLKRRLTSSRFVRIETVAPARYAHCFRARSIRDLDEQVAGWLQEAYEAGVGAQRGTSSKRGRPGPLTKPRRRSR